MLTESDVRAALRLTLDSAAPDAWDPDFDFLDGALDSLDHATFLLNLEEVHGLKVPEEDVVSLKSIRAVLEYAERAAADEGT